MDGVTKLCDFGLAIDSTIDPPRSRVGTLEFMAPELIDLGGPPGCGSACTSIAAASADDHRRSSCEALYGPSVDVWSFGCVVYELLFGAALFGGDGVSEATIVSQIRSVADAPVVFPDYTRAGREVSERALRLISVCAQLARDGETPESAAEAAAAAFRRFCLIRPPEKAIQWAADSGGGLSFPLPSSAAQAALMHSVEDRPGVDDLLLMDWVAADAAPTRARRASVGSTPSPLVALTGNRGSFRIDSSAAHHRHGPTDSPASILPTAASADAPFAVLVERQRAAAARGAWTASFAGGHSLRKRLALLGPSQGGSCMALEAFSPNSTLAFPSSSESGSRGDSSRRGSLERGRTQQLLPQQSRRAVQQLAASETSRGHGSFGTDQQRTLAGGHLQAEHAEWQEVAPPPPLAAGSVRDLFAAARQRLLQLQGKLPSPPPRPTEDSFSRTFSEPTSDPYPRYADTLDSSLQAAVSPRRTSIGAMDERLRPLRLAVGVSPAAVLARCGSIISPFRPRAFALTPTNVVVPLDAASGTSVTGSASSLRESDGDGGFRHGQLRVPLGRRSAPDLRALVHGGSTQVLQAGETTAELRRLPHSASQPRLQWLRRTLSVGNLGRPPPPQRSVSVLRRIGSFVSNLFSPPTSWPRSPRQSAGRRRSMAEE